METSIETRFDTGPLPLAALEELRLRLGEPAVLTEPEDILPYGFDGTAVLKQSPAAVLLPRSTEAVPFILDLARRFRRPIVTRGSGTGLSGGSVPVAGAIVLCLVHCDRILEVDTKNLTLLAEAGVVTQTIFETAAQEGLFYPPDPGSMKISTIGGNVAENSGGLRGLKYGVTRDYVMGLEVVLPDGRVCWLGNKCVKDVAGYNLRDLFIGSEGTLGVITKVLLKLLPQPQARQTLLAVFDSMEAAAGTVSAIIAAKIIPCTLEFLDRTTIRCVEDFARVGLPGTAEAVLLIESDGHPAAVEEEAGRIRAICHENGAASVRVAADAVEATQLATARRSAFSALARMRPTTILEDVTVPRSELAGMIRSVQEASRKHGLMIATFGHFGDGNLHPTILTDERDAEEMERVEHAFVDIVAATLLRGGTVTGEHGVGIAKKRFLRQQLGDDSFSLLQLVKQSFDPEGRLNPGKIFDGEAAAR